MVVSFLNIFYVYFILRWVKLGLWLYVHWCVLYNKGWKLHLRCDRNLNAFITSELVILPCSWISVSSIVTDTPSSRHFFMCALDFMCLVRFPAFKRQMCFMNEVKVAKSIWWAGAPPEVAKWGPVNNIKTITEFQEFEAVLWRLFEM